jgi:hypothetical protein
VLEILGMTAALVAGLCGFAWWLGGVLARRWDTDSMRSGGYMVPAESGDVEMRLEMERAAYVAGRIDVVEFERQVELVLSGQMGKPQPRDPGKPEWSGSGARGPWQIAPNAVIASRRLKGAEEQRLHLHLVTENQRSAGRRRAAVWLAKQRAKGEPDEGMGTTGQWR